MSGWEVFQLWLIAFLTLALFSFMYRDNPIYRVAEHIFAGLTAGYQVGLIWDTIIIQQLWNPMLGGNWWLFIPGLLGVLMFTRFSSKFSWVSRTSLAFVMGVTAGIFLISELHGRVLPQMQDTMIPATELVSKAEDGYATNLAEFEVFQVPCQAPTAEGDDSLATAPSVAPLDGAYPHISAGAPVSDKPLVWRDRDDFLTLSVEFTDTVPLEFGDYYAVGFEIRHHFDQTTHPLAQSTVYGDDNIEVSGTSNGRFTARFLFDPAISHEVGDYDLMVKVERRSVMFLLSIIIVVGVLSTLIYFYFSKEHKGALGVTARVGIWFIMISFGAHFGYTVMGRVSLLIGRVQFLIEDWIGSFL